MPQSVTLQSNSSGLSFHFVSERFPVDSLSAKTFSFPGMCTADSYIPWLAHHTHSSWVIWLHVRLRPPPPPPLHAINILYSSSIIDHSFHVQILNLWAECLQGKKTWQDFKIIDVILWFILSPLPPGCNGVEDSSPTSQICIWIDCDLPITVGSSVRCVSNIFNPPVKVRSCHVWENHACFKIAFVHTSPQGNLQP